MTLYSKSFESFTQTLKFAVIVHHHGHHPPHGHPHVLCHDDDHCRSLQRATRTAVAARPHGSVQQGEFKISEDLLKFYWEIKNTLENDHRVHVQLERPAVNESDAVVLTFGLTLQQIIDVVTFIVFIVIIVISYLKKFPSRVLIRNLPLSNHLSR